MPPGKCNFFVYGHPDQQLQFFCSDIKYGFGYNPDTGTGYYGFEVSRFYLNLFSCIFYHDLYWWPKVFD